MNYYNRITLARMNYQYELDSIERERIELDLDKVKESKNEILIKIHQFKITKAKCIEEIAKLDIEYYKSINNIE
jgi:hypothetical protein